MKTVKVTVEFEFETEAKGKARILEEAFAHLVAQVEDESIQEFIETEIIADDEEDYV